MTTRWRNYSGNLRKIVNIIGPTTSEKIWINYVVVSTLLHNAVYSNFFLSCWTMMLKISEVYLNNFSTELSSQIFDCCPRNFLIQEKQNGNVVSTSHWIRPVKWRNGKVGLNFFKNQVLDLTKGVFVSENVQYILHHSC